MYTDFLTTDLAGVFERGPPTQIRLVCAEKSDFCELSDCLELKALAEAAIANQEHPDAGLRARGVEVDVVEKAGHWLHVDNPSGLAKVMAQGFQDVLGRSDY